MSALMKTIKNMVSKYYYKNSLYCLSKVKYLVSKNSEQRQSSKSKCNEKSISISTCI